MSRDEKDEEMSYELTMDERHVLRDSLAALPETMPPRAVWRRIREQAEAEGLMSNPRSRQPSTWYMGGGLAAAAMLVIVILPGRFEATDSVTEGTDFPVVPQVQTSPPTIEVNSLQALMVESRQLESDLRSLPNEPRVVRAGTQATIVELEDRIAAIDYQLSESASQMSPQDQEIFWRERVRLMNSLVRLRYAQAQRTAF